MRRRIVGLALAASMLAITLFGLPLAAAVAAYTVTYGEGELERVADAAALAVAADLFGEDPLGPLPASPDDTLVGVYDLAGVRIAGEGPGREDAFVAGALRGHTHAGDDSDELVVAIPVTHDGDVIGVVRAAQPLALVHRQIALLWVAMLALGVVAILIVGLLAKHQAGRLARPLEEMADVARAMGEGEFNLRNPPARVAEIDAVGSALNRASERLEDMLARERAFSAEASHQLRTPLTGLRLRLEAALDRPNQNLPETIAAAISDTERLERTISELLALARDRHHASEPLELAALLRELEQSWGPRLAVEGRVLRIVEDDVVDPALASTPAVRQVLNVILDNATVHGKGSVTVTVRESAGAMAIDVSDQGGPITRSDQELFTRSSNGTEGHGIGLALARRLAEAEGGRLRLTRPLPPTFTLLLPTTDSAPEPGPDSASRSVSESAPESAPESTPESTPESAHESAHETRGSHLDASGASSR